MAIRDLVAAEFAQYEQDRTRRSAIDQYARRQQGSVLSTLGDVFQFATAPTRYALAGLDAPRRGVQSLMWMAGGRDPADAWALAEEGENIYKEISGLNEDTWTSWSAGMAIDVVTDPLTYIGFGELTQSGKVAERGGKLATTWAAQAAKGQRAALTLWTPWKTHTLVKGPGFVRGLGSVGQSLKNIPLVKRLSRKFTTRSLDPRVNQIINNMMEQSGGDVADLYRWRDEALRFRSKLNPQQFREVVDIAEAYSRPGVRHQRFMEHAYTTLPKERILQGITYHRVNEAFRHMMNAKGIQIDDLGAGISHRLSKIGDMKRDELNILLEAKKRGILQFDNRAAKLYQKASQYDEALEVTSKSLDNLSGHRGRREFIELSTRSFDEAVDANVKTLVGDLDKIMKSGFKRAGGRLSGALKRGAMPQEAAALWDAYAQKPQVLEDLTRSILAGEASTDQIRIALRDTLSRRQYGRAVEVLTKIDDLAKRRVQAGQKAKQVLYARRDRLNRRITKTASQAADARARAATALRARINLETGAVSSQKLDRLVEAEKVFRTAQDDIPNFVMRIMTPAARERLTQLGDTTIGGSGRVWSPELRGILSRRMAERIMDGKEVYLRPWSLLELESALKAPQPGTRIEKWSRFIRERGGLFGAIDELFKAKKTANLERMYDLDPQSAIYRLTEKAKRALRGKELWRQLASADDVLSDVPHKGWHHVKDIGPDAMEELSKLGFRDGQAWVSPEMFDELRRVYTNFADPNNINILNTAWNKFTKMFKWSVTRPFPAYHARNHIEDSVRMLYNGPYDPIKVHEAGVRGLLRNSAYKNTTIYLNKELKEVPIDHAWRLAEAYDVVQAGEQAGMAMQRGNGRVQQLGRGLDAMFSAPEDMRRFGYWVERMNRGYSPYSASQQVQRVLFDYKDLTRWEQQVATQIIPFYTYMKNSLRLHAKEIFHHPGLMHRQYRAIEASSRDVPDSENVPEWVRGRFYMALSPDDQTGEERLLAAYGLPIQDVVELLDFSGGFKPWFERMSFRLHPVIRSVPMYGEASTRDYPAYAPKMFADLPEDIRNMIGVRERRSRSGETYVTIDPVYNLLFETAFTRFYSTARGLGRDRSPLEHALKYGGGMSVIRYDPYEVRKRQERRSLREILQLAERRGDISAIPGFYKPRGSGMSELEFMMLRARQKAVR